jgi:hypothetical protein
MLPKTLKYGSKVESAVARSSRVNIAPQNGTGNYGLGDTIILNIPTRNNLVLVPTESYLKFNVAVTAKAADGAFRWDSSGAHGLIQRIRIFHGSNLLEDIDNYGLLSKILFDLQKPSDSTYGKDTLLCGTRSDTVTQFQAIATPNATVGADATTAATLVNALKTVLNSGRVPSYQTNSGERIGGDRVALTANNGVVSETYCLNLVSLIGSLSSANYIPVFAMSSAPLRVEIQLVDTFFKACSDLASTSAATSATIALSNVEYVANFIELGDSAMSIIYGSLEGQPLQFVIPQFRNYQYSQTIVGTADVNTNITMPIPAKFSSLKSIMTTVRLNGSGTFGGQFPFSTTNSGLVDYQFRVGAQIIPAKAPNTPAEWFSEALKAMGSIADLHYTPSIDKLSYTIVAPVASNDSATNVSSSSSGSFVIGLDLENYSSAPKDTIFAGLNTNTDDIFLIMNFKGRGGGDALTRFDAFANMDSVLVCESGNAYIKF